VIVTVANVIDAPTSSTSSTIRERFSPSGLSHRSVRSRPATTTRDPFDTQLSHFCIAAGQRAALFPATAVFRPYPG
jgi:hypothetical protein